MDEKELELLFKTFLLTKGYREENLLFQKALKEPGANTYRPDLLILDLTNQEYIAIIEFKRAISQGGVVTLVGQFYRYFARLGSSDIPAFVVFPIDDNDFQILSLTKNNDLVPIIKEDFPSYETLSAKKLTDEKIKQREVEERNLQELARKRYKTRIGSYLALTSLMIGLFTTILFLSGSKSRLFLFSSNESCCATLFSKFDSIQNEINNLENRLSSIINKPTIIDTSKKLVQSQEVDRRLKILEDGISNSPERALAILDVRKEIELLKKSDESQKDLNQSKIDALKEQLNIQNGWVIGIAIAIFGSILAIWLPNILPRRDDTNRP